MIFIYMIGRVFEHLYFLCVLTCFSAITTLNFLTLLILLCEKHFIHKCLTLQSNQVVVYNQSG